MSKEMFRRADYVRDIEFFINGQKHVVSDKFPPFTTLNNYIRTVAGLTGTKVMCKEGGCGCCAVTVTYAMADEKAETMSINSCLCPLYSVDGWQISTVEGIGSTRYGLHPIQDRMARYNATQCGFCSPGFIMSMYGLMHQNPKASQQDIEDSFDGSMCRCTGYRPILDAMKSFASDSTAVEKTLDIEDLNKHLCPKTGEKCGTRNHDNENEIKGFLPRSLNIDLIDYKWYRPLNLEELCSIMKCHTDDTVKMFNGNSSAGIYKRRGPYKAYVDLKAVLELHVYNEIDSSVILGGGTTITDLKRRLKVLRHKPGFHYAHRMDQHLNSLASTLIRNVACVSGRLMIKHRHRQFPSDLFVSLEAVGTKAHIYGKTEYGQTYFGRGYIFW